MANGVAPRFGRVKSMKYTFSGESLEAVQRTDNTCEIRLSTDVLLLPFSDRERFILELASTLGVDVRKAPLIGSIDSEIHLCQ